MLSLKGWLHLHGDKTEEVAWAEESHPESGFGLTAYYYSQPDCPPKPHLSFLSSVLSVGARRVLPSPSPDGLVQKGESGLLEQVPLVLLQWTQRLWPQMSSPSCCEH